MQETAFGKYRLIAILGHGGMADVYLAVVTGPAGFSKLQVIKRMRQELTEDEEHLAMFLDEARLAARLNHPNVVQTFEVGQEEGEYYLAMEYLEGAPLNSIVSRARSNPAPPGVLLRVVADTLAGLHYAHELKDYDGTALNIVHRDATPHNIFVTYDGQTKVVDFGIAKNSTRSTETRTGVLRGKVGYMAPEQARCRPLDRRADIFALGIVLWEILAGRTMWERQSEVVVLHRVGTGNLPLLGEVRSDTPPELARICARALALEPQDRYATAAEMRGDLLAYMDGTGLKVSAEDVGRYVGKLFADKREEIRATIERQLSQLSMAQDGTLAELSNAPESESTSLPRIEIGSGRVGAAGTGRRGNASGSTTDSSLRSIPPPVPMTQETTSPTPAASPNKRLVMALGAMALFAGLAVFFFASKRGTDAPSAAESGPAPTGTVGVAAQPNADSAPPPAGSGAAAAKGQMIQITVRAIPAHADVFLDGARLPTNPFTGKFPADGVSHRLHAEAVDYRIAGKIVTFDRDGSIELVLEAKSGSTASRADSAQVPSSPVALEPTAPVLDTSSPPTGSLAAKPLASGKPKRHLDSATPWSSSASPAATTTGAKRKLDSNPW
jgi:serine/threonine-protein kinase